VTHGCDYPPDVVHLPRITSTGIPKDASSGEIDRLVRERHAAGLPLYELDRALLAALRPDLLVTQGLCDVCAIPEALAREAACDLPGSCQVLSLAPVTLADVFANVLDIGVATDRADTARTLVNQLRSRVNRIAHLTSQVSRRPRVTLLEWLDPLYSCG